MVEAGSECSGILTAELLQLPGIAQNVASQGMPSEYQVLEIIEDELGRIVFVGLYLVDNHLCLLLYLALRKGGVEYNIRQKFEGTAEMLGQESRVNHRFFLVGVGVEVTAHILHAVQDVPCLALGGTFEYEVLHKMRHTLLVFKLVARTRIYGKTTISHFGGRGFMNDAQAVGQDISVESRR